MLGREGPCQGRTLTEAMAALTVSVESVAAMRYATRAQYLLDVSRSSKTRPRRLTPRPRRLVKNARLAGAAAEGAGERDDGAGAAMRAVFAASHVMFGRTVVTLDVFLLAMRRR